MEQHVKSDPNGNKQSYPLTFSREQRKQDPQQQRAYQSSSRYRTNSRSTVSQTSHVVKHTSLPTTAITGSIALLELILADDDSQDYDQRTKYAQQLAQFITDASTSGVIQWHRQDMMQIVETCTRYSEAALSDLLSSPHVPLPMKESMIRILASAACHTRLDLLMVWLLERLDQCTTDTSTEYTLWLLSILHETILRAQLDSFTQRQLQECMPSIMNSLILYLDSPESIQLLEKVLMVLSSLAEYYSTIFVSYFQDIVDLLVGWYLDVNVSEQNCLLIQSTLISYEPCWKTSVVFGFEILQHFISDLYARVQQIETVKSFQDTTTEIQLQIQSCQRLLSCFHCLSRVIVPLVSLLDQYHQITMLFSQIQSDSVMLFLQALNNETLTSQTWFDQSNQIMLLMSSVQPNTFQPLQHTMYYYITTQLEQSFMTPLVYIGYLLKMLDLWKSTGINQEVYEQLLDATLSPLFPLMKTYQQNQKQLIHQGALMIIRYLFGALPDSVIHTYSAQWIQLIQPDLPEPLPDTNMAMPQTTLAIETYQTHTNTTTEPVLLLDPILYCRLFLETASVVKSPAEDSMRIELECQVLVIMLTFWKSGDTKHFNTVLKLLTNSWSHISHQQLQAALYQDLTQPNCWVKLSLDSKRTLLNSIVLNCTIVSNLLHLLKVDATLPSIQQKIVHLLTTHGQQHSLIECINNDTMTTLLLLMNSSNLAIRKSDKGLLKSLNPFIMTCLDSTHSFHQTYSMPNLKVMVMASPHTGAFRPVHYEIAMKQLGMQHLLVGTSPDTYDSKDTNSSLDWARRLFYSCGGTQPLINNDLFQYKELDKSRLESLFNRSRSLLYYWTLWECSRYCILSRLRTPFGGPQQTFAAFEKTLVALADSSSDDTQLQGLLILLDRLEMQISNATEGSTGTTMKPSTLPTVPKGSFNFFYTNRKTCQDYYSRIRPLMVQCARKLNYDPLFLKHSFILLSDYEKQLFASGSPSVPTVLAFFEKTNPCVRNIVDVCIHHRLVDTIGGLEAWYQHIVSKLCKIVPLFKKDWYFNGLVGPLPVSLSLTLVSWFQICISFAKGYDEDAITQMTQYINITSDLTSSGYLNEILALLDKHMLHFYTSLEDYGAIRSVCQRNPRLFSTEISKLLVEFTMGSESRANDTDLSTFSTLINDLGPLDHSERMVQLSRLSVFRKATFSESNNKHLSHLVSQHLFSCLEKEDQPLDSLVFDTTRAHLIEIQLQHLLYEKQLDLNNGDRVIDLAATLHGITDTKICARLTSTATKPELYLLTAQAARQQCNYRAASNYLEKVISTGNMKIKNLVMYEKIELDCHINTSEQTLVALDSLAQEIITGGFEQRELEIKVYLKMAAVLQQPLDFNLMKQISKPSPDSWIHTVLEKATNCAGDHSAKPWFIYGNYHYQQACGFLDAIQSLLTGQSYQDNAMISQARDTWTALLSALTPEQFHDTEKFLWNIFKTFSATLTHGKFTTSKFVIEKCQQHGLASHVDVLAALDTTQDWLLTHFRAALTGFSKYLDLTHGHDSEPSLSSMMMLSTLHLVQILVQYGEILQDTFTEHTTHAFTQTQQLAWKHITPQLFSRLANHPSAFVKRILSQWIGQLVDTCPHEMIYRVIVGLDCADQDTRVILKQQAEKIRRGTGNTWVTTQKMTQELEKITVLWEETWLHRISTLQLDVMNQWQQIDQLPNGTLDNYQTLMHHVIQSVSDLILATIDTQACKTPHEDWFDTTFGPSIRRAFELLRTPDSLDTYRKGWDRFQQIHRRLTIETQKLRVVKLDQVSPYLASLDGETSIQMPGLAHPIVHIHHFGTTVTILPTKTKPKKMDIHGTDGNTYTYLFKGLEDLQLDERIMQLLKTTNVLLREDLDASDRQLNARTYAVIPVSDQAGMIQWVQQATPLFALYKNWQKRDYFNTLFHQQQQQPQQQQPQVQRPTEYYTDKVLLKMKEQGLSATANRRHWPVDILRIVHQELASETPDDLLSKAIWWSSTDSLEQMSKTHRFARTMAVMSMIGYVIGLGDRHLDNILMDDRTGEIIHIDYNVCFEKGTTLRVPERVPYRLTRNMVHALGLAAGVVSGQGGLFRTAAEHTLRILRRHKELLMGLMEDALVVDSLLMDWDQGKSKSKAGGLIRAGVAKEEQQHIELQSRLMVMATRLAGSVSLREKQHASIMHDLSMMKQLFEQSHQSQQQRQEEEEEESDYDEENDLAHNEDIYYMSPSGPIKSLPEEDWELESRSAVQQTQLKHQLVETMDQLNQPYNAVSSDTPLSIRDILPLLDSISMLELDENNEIHVAQESAKMILDTLRFMDDSITNLDAKESVFSLMDLIDMLRQAMNQLDLYYSSLRMLESFGQQEQRNMDDVSGRLKQDRKSENSSMKRVRQKLEGKDADFCVDISDTMTVAEQVAKTIEQATCVDNLSLMYEGWTSWV